MQCVDVTWRYSKKVDETATRRNECPGESPGKGTADSRVLTCYCCGYWLCYFGYPAAVWSHVRMVGLRGSCCVRL